MAILTEEIKKQIRVEAEKRLRDGNLLVVIAKDDIDDYSKILEGAFINDEFVLE